MDLKAKVLFKVSLSNGETYYEGKGEYQEIPGQPMPWRRLYNSVIERGLRITSLSLYTEDGRTFNLPSAGKNPKFPEFAKLERPIDFNVERKLGLEHDVVGNQVKSTVMADHYTVAEVTYPSHKLQIWVDEMDTRNSWVLVVNT